MLGVKLICVGKMREKHYVEALKEYEKRLTPFCRLEIEELPECRLPENPSAGEIAAALDREAGQILTRIPAGAWVCALCIEGEMRSSEELAELLRRLTVGGVSRAVFLIGGSCGLHERVKARADERLSMSRMTFPHHLARVMLAEQLYRAFSILSGGKYHK
jgi:23S rRNA (pseudouridine1915-N3)-methyltransferase